MKLNSLVREHNWAWSGDPAMDSPPQDAKKKQLDAWAVKLTNARDTGDYSGVTKAGESLSLFSLRIIPKVMFDRVRDDVQTSKIGVHVGNCLLVRLAVRSVINLTDFDEQPVNFDLKAAAGFDEIAPNELLDLLQAYSAQARMRGWGGADLIAEMADHIVVRQNGPSPK